MNVDMDVTPVLIVSVVFLTAAIIVATVFLFIHRANELRHQTIRLALEKGQPIPPDLLDGRKPKARGNDLTSGIKLVFTGTGISVFFALVQHRFWPIGLIVVFVGLGHLAAYALTGRSQPATPSAG